MIDTTDAEKMKGALIFLQLLLEEKRGVGIYSAHPRRRDKYTRERVKERTGRRREKIKNRGADFFFFFFKECVS